MPVLICFVFKISRWKEKVFGAPEALVRACKTSNLDDDSGLCENTPFLLLKNLRPCNSCPPRQRELTPQPLHSDLPRASLRRPVVSSDSARWPSIIHDSPGLAVTGIPLLQTAIREGSRAGGRPGAASTDPVVAFRGLCGSSESK